MNKGACSFSQEANGKGAAQNPALFDLLVFINVITNTTMELLISQSRTDGKISSCYKSHSSHSLLLIIPSKYKQNYY
jgi:hypothetical protein